MTCRDAAPQRPRPGNYPSFATQVPGCYAILTVGILSEGFVRSLLIDIWVCIEKPKGESRPPMTQNAASGKDESCQSQSGSLKPASHQRHPLS